MNRNIFVVGVVVLIIGIVLTLAFWPLFGVRASTLEEDREGLIYDSYSRDDKILVHGTITDIRIDDFPDWMEEIGFSKAVHVELDDEFEFIIRDETDIKFSEGDSVYGRMVLREEAIIFGIGRFEYWELSGSIGSKQMVDIVFYITTGLGLVITVAGYIKV